MRTIIAGSRSILDQDYIDRLLDNLVSKGLNITEVVCGRAIGVDSLGESWGHRRNIPVIPFPANWADITRPGAVIRINRYGAKYNAKAGFDRNEDMAVYASQCPDGGALVLIWNGHSSGSGDMKIRANKHGLLIIEYILN